MYIPQIVIGLILGLILGIIITVSFFSWISRKANKMVNKK